MPLVNTIPPAPTDPTTVTQSVLRSMQKKAIGHDSGVLSATDAVLFDAVPGPAQSAILVVEAAPGTTADVIARYWADGMWPDALNGLPIYDGSVLEIAGQDDVNNLRIISADGGLHKVNIQYYSGI